MAEANWAPLDMEKKMGEPSSLTFIKHSLEIELVDSSNLGLHLVCPDVHVIFKGEAPHNFVYKCMRLDWDTRILGHPIFNTI